MPSERLHLRGRIRLWWIGWRYRHGFYDGPIFDNVEELLEYCFNRKGD